MSERSFRGKDAQPRERGVISSGRPRPAEPVACFADQVGELAEALHHATSRPELFDAFASGVADALGADFVQLLEYYPEERCFVLQAGRGFSKRPYAEMRVPAGLRSQAGRAMLDPAGSPVTLGDFSNPHEWADGDLSRECGARSGIVVKIATSTRDFGTLGVFFRSTRRFSLQEECFLMCAAGLLGSGAERLECEKAATA